MQFLSFADTLRKYHRLPDPDRDPLKSRAVELRVKWPSGEAQDLWLEIVATRPYFGGVRQWFCCLDCGRRVGKLYCPAPDKSFACRHCLNLVYRCQYDKHPLLVHSQKIKRLCRKLGLPDLLAPLQA